jgi:Transglutaminase-like superfamily
MTSAGPLIRLRRLSGEQKRLLVGAIALLALASAGVSLLPFRRVIRFGCVPPLNRRASIDDVVWAVEAAARRVPWRTMCIEKGLVVQRMLRSGGLDAILHYGARHHDETHKLEAHVWVTVGGRAVIGGADVDKFVAIASYP